MTSVTVTAVRCNLTSNAAAKTTIVLREHGAIWMHYRAQALQECLHRSRNLSHEWEGKPCDITLSPLRSHFRRCVRLGVNITECPSIVTPANFPKINPEPMKIDMAHSQFQPQSLRPPWHLCHCILSLLPRTSTGAHRCHCLTSLDPLREHGVRLALWVNPLLHEVFVGGRKEFEMAHVHRTNEVRDNGSAASLFRDKLPTVQ